MGALGAFCVGGAIVSDRHELAHRLESHTGQRAQSAWQHVFDLLIHSLSTETLYSKTYRDGSLEQRDFDLDVRFSYSALGPIGTI